MAGITYEDILNLTYEPTDTDLVYVFYVELAADSLLTRRRLAAARSRAGEVGDGDAQVTEPVAFHLPVGI